MEETKIQRKRGPKPKSYYVTHGDLETWALSRIKSRIDSGRMSDADQDKFALELVKKTAPTKQRVETNMQVTAVNKNQADEIAQITRQNIRQSQIDLKPEQ
jgi:hypothetical protein